MYRPMRWMAAAAAALTLLAGCGGDDGPVELRLAGTVDRPTEYRFDDVARGTPVTQTVSYISGSGTQTRTYTGTPLWQLLSEAGIQTNPEVHNDVLNRYVLASAADGYRVVFALGEIHPDFGNKPGLVVYNETVNGASVRLPDGDGPLRVTAPGDVRGGRYVSMLNRLDVRASGSTLAGIGGGSSPGFTVSGAVLRQLSFDLGSLQALPAVTQDVNGSVYTGVSLWNLLNTEAGIRTDSAAAHNPLLSMYVVATGSDGYKAIVSLGEIHPNFGNRPAMIAYSVNGELLDRNGMARLVVPGDVRAGRFVSNLVGIEVFQAPPPAP
ncbi:MAG: molybdopterin-binding oxidoreductase [Burkholderiaceae bacterium]